MIKRLLVYGTATVAVYFAGKFAFGDDGPNMQDIQAAGVGALFLMLALFVYEMWLKPRRDAKRQERRRQPPQTRERRERYELTDSDD